MKKYLFAAALLSGVSFLLVAAPAFSAPRGGGGGGHSGGHGGGAYHGGGGHSGAYHGGNHYHYGGYGLRFGIYPGIYGGYYGGGYPYSYGGGYGVTPIYSYYPSTPSVVGPGPNPDSNTAAPAGIRVVLPDPQAIVFFDGAKTSSTGAIRMFHTPNLTPGANAKYQIRAIWQQNGKEVVQDRTVPVAPGQLSVADFTQPPSELLPLPK